jgi:shikimate dehydrogenase
VKPISGRTRLFCVLGHPVSHSLSPAMHNAALAALGEEAVYAAFDVAPERLAAALEGLEALSVVGANLTIPHKEAALRFARELSPEAELIGAVNTLCFADGRRRGENTDGRGFLAALRDAGFTPEGCRAVVLGAGGSARAVAVSLGPLAARLVLANRTPERAAALADLVNGHFGAGRAYTLGMEADRLAGELAEANLLVNTTSVGMVPHADAPPLVPEAALHPGLFVYDLVYNPPETRLLACAKRQGAAGRNGLSMLARQGALSLEAWLGRPAPAELMERECARALGFGARADRKEG